ncbi:MAG: ATP-grasp domain-containing protein [Solirubrobacterales bacterium]
MRFYEYESRRIVEAAGIPVTEYGFAKTADEAREAVAMIDGPTVIKSQVLVGGRMKAGGVKFADTPDEAAAHADEILKLEISGHMPVGVLVDPKAEITQEYYAAVLWDGRAKRPMMLFSDMGGIDIEEVAERHPDHVGRGHLSNLHPIPDFRAKEVVAAVGMTGRELTRATPVLARLAQLQRDYDMTLAEINPLARLSDGSFVALDAHMEMEDEAVPRQTKRLGKLDIEVDEPRELYEPSEFERNVKAIDEADHRGVIQGKDHGFEGNLGLVIGAGGGSLTLTDAVRSQGGRPANYAEIGGNPSVAKAKGLAMEVLKKDGVERIAVMMSIVSNTRVDIVARGVIKACLELGKDPAETITVFRIPGAWEEEGSKILGKYGIEFRDRSTSMWEAAGEAVEKVQGRAAPGREAEEAAP